MLHRPLLHSPMSHFMVRITANHGVLERGPTMTTTRRARAAARLTAATLRPLALAVPANRTGLVMTRAIIASSMALLGPADPRARTAVIDTSTPRGRVMGEWVRAPRVVRDDAVILYLHGSAFVACSPRTHRGLTARLSSATGLPVFTCRYRRAPRHRFPAAADDAFAAYHWLVAAGHQRIVIAADSAGGHLAVDLALELARRGDPAPAGLVLFSPLYDLTFELAATRERVRRDPMISARRARGLVEHYTRGVAPDHDRLRLAVRSSPALPPVLIQAGGAEMLSADAEQLAADLLAAGGVCTLQVWPDQMHVFQALPVVVPQAREALQDAAAFMRDALASDRPARTAAPPKEMAT